jgi:hypothetical protein
LPQLNAMLTTRKIGRITTYLLNAINVAAIWATLVWAQFRIGS